MCGNLQLTSKEFLSLHPEKLVPKELFTPRPKRDLQLSSHRFIRAEKAAWWRRHVDVLSAIHLEAAGFYEHGLDHYFEIPKGYKIRCVMHTALDGSNWVFSILTTDTSIPALDPQIELLRQKVVLVHHRIPLLQVV